MYAVRFLFVFLAVTLLAPAQIDAPPEAQTLLRDVANNEAEFLRVRGEYTYRQQFEFWEVSDQQHRRGGFYSVTTDVTFTPEGKRFEKTVHGPVDALRFLRMTHEDIDDLRSVVPLVLTPDKMRDYYARLVGSEPVSLRDGEGKPTGKSVEALVFTLSPRQTFPGHRYFDGRIWIDPQTKGIVQISGKADPPIRVWHHGHEEENLFGKFTTYFQRVDGRYWFPVYTEGDDWLDFSSGAIEIRDRVRFANYRRFRAKSRILTIKPVSR